MSMASKASFSDDLKAIKKSLPKSLLLRDYLLDDMSSCSSNGFRSYPRRQCCTTVRYLVELDPSKNRNQPTKKRQYSKTKPKQPSVLQRASAVMINAFKHFPFAGAGNPRKADFMQRGPSRKLFKHGFWKKTDHHKNNIKQLKSFGDLIKEKETTTNPPPHHKNDIKQLKSFGDFIKEKETTTPPPHHKNDIKLLKSFGDFMKEKEATPPPSPSHFSTAVTTNATAELNISTSNNNSNIRSSSDLTAITDSFSTGGNTSEGNSSQNDVVDDLQENNQTTNEKRAGATVTNYSSTTENAKKWQNERDEQFSPVSVMDFPCDDDNNDDVNEVSYDFQGTKRLMHKARRFEGDHQFEPMKLENRITQLVLESSAETCSEFAQEENQVEKKVVPLLQLMKSTIPCHPLFKFEAVESLLLAFFREKIIEENISDYEMLQIAKDWMDGQIQDMFLDWKSHKNRQTYIIEIEKKENWFKYDDEVEKENVGLELEYEIFSSLVNDILLDFLL